MNASSFFCALTKEGRECSSYGELLISYSRFSLNDSLRRTINNTIEYLLAKAIDLYEKENIELIKKL